MNLQLPAQDIITKSGTNVENLLSLAFHHMDSNRYLQPQIGQISLSDVSIPINTYDSAQYVKIPLGNITKYNNQATNAIEVVDGSLKTFDDFKYIIIYSYHVNISQPSPATKNAANMYERFSYADTNDAYVQTGSNRFMFPTWVEANTYIINTNVTNMFYVLNRTNPDRLLNLDFYVDVNNVASYKFERMRLVYIAVPLESE